MAANLNYPGLWWHHFQDDIFNLFDKHLLQSNFYLGPSVGKLRLLNYHRIKVPV